MLMSFIINLRKSKKQTQKAQKKLKNGKKWQKKGKNVKNSINL